MRNDKTIGMAWGAVSMLAAATSGQASTADAQTIQKPISIVAFGDSLTAGYRLNRRDAFPAQLERALRAKGYDVTIRNAGVSGDTSGSGLARVNRDVPPSADLVILEFGANDILRGISPTVTERNLDAILDRLKRNGSDVILAGMIAPPGFGNAFSRSFGSIFQNLAAKHSATLYPFFLDGIAMRSALNLDDGIHPNAAGISKIVEGILPVVSARLDALT